MIAGCDADSLVSLCFAAFAEPWRALRSNALKLLTAEIAEKGRGGRKESAGKSHLGPNRDEPEREARSGFLQNRNFGGRAAGLRPAGQPRRLSLRDFRGPASFFDAGVAVVDGVEDELHAAGDAQFFEDPEKIFLDGVLAEVELEGDGTIG
jgi:hypothetical protein